jgi:chemotaxis regulatin CheY-phosphate phosphatase CheZ
MDIKVLKAKVNELKALFVLAQRVIPFMEELFLFIEDTTPLLEDINNAIKENLKKMPNASKQLSKVTQATEMASTEIMDTVDRVNGELYKVIEELEEFKNNQEQLFNNPITLLETLIENIVNGKDLSPHIEEIKQFITRVQDIKNTEHTKIITDIIARVQDISDDANTIINSLQIQDITAQQLAAVNHLLENVQSRLSDIMKNINADVADVAVTTGAKFDDSIKVSTLHRNIAFDPDAVDSITQENRQSDIDAMLANPDLMLATETNNQAEKVENKNALINASNPQNFNTPTTISSAEEKEMDEEFSQDDIDALFQNG